MPLYNFICDHCGPFEAWLPMAEASGPSACPACSELGHRAISAPRLNRMNGSLRGALDGAAKTSDEPKVVTKDELSRIGKPKGHGHHHHSPARRWMVGHC